MKTESDAQELNEAKIIENVIHAAETLKTNLAKLCQEKTAFDLLSTLKFEHVGSNPEQGCGSYHLIEQINQSMTYLTTALALRWLKEQYPSLKWYGNLGATGGTDIYSCDGSVLCEVFAAVNATNNQKLNKDIAKVKATKGNASKVSRYVFCCLKEQNESEVDVTDGVTVVKFPIPSLAALGQKPSP